MPEAPIACQEGTEKAEKDILLSETRVNPCMNREVQNVMDKDRPNYEKVRPFRAVTGAHMECGHLPNFKSMEPPIFKPMLPLKPGNRKKA